MTHSTETSGDCAALPEGLQIFGYTLLNVMGSGGFGITYKARRDEDGLMVVIKESLPRHCAFRTSGSLQVQERPDIDSGGRLGFNWAKDNFLNEASVLAALNYPNIVKVLDAFETDETATSYYVMPHVSDYSLQDYILKGGVKDRKWVLYLLSSLLGALNYIHNLESPLLHRDIKPENILIAEDGTPVLIDFGSSREAAVDLKTRLVTHSFSPIEQSRGTGEGPWTDLYSVGATMYYLITGKLVPSFERRTPKEADEYRPLADMPELEGVYGSALLSSIDKALAYNPEGRFQSALEWAEVLQTDPHFQSHLAILPPHVPKKKRVVPVPEVDNGVRKAYTELPPVKKRLPMALLFILLFVLACLVGGGYYLHHEKIWPFHEEPTPAPVQPAEPETTPEEVVPAAPEPPSKVQLRILAKPGTKLYSVDGNTEQNVRVPVLAIYYVDNSNGTTFTANGQEFYCVSSRPGEAVCGSIRTEDAIPWSTSLAMRLTHPGGLIQRDVSLYYKDAAHAEAYAGLAQSQRDAIQKAAHTYKTPEELAATLEELSPSQDLGIIGREPLQWNKDGHLLPIIGFHKDEEGREISVAYSGNNSRKTKIYQVAAIGKPQADEQANSGGESAGRKLRLIPTDGSMPRFESIDIVFVIDTTQSMRPFITGVKKTIATIIETLERESMGTPLRYGIVGYRDTHFQQINGKRENASSVEYTTRNYTKQLLRAPEFLKLLDNVKAAEKPTVGYMEDVFAGLHAALGGDDSGSKPEWGANSAKFIFLIGDAPGRAPGEREDARLCSDRNRPLGTKSTHSLETQKSKLSSARISLATTFILTRQRGVRPSVWTKYELKGIEQFRKLAYSSYSKEEGALFHFSVFNKTGRPIEGKIKAEIGKEKTAYDFAGLVDETDDEAIAQAFSQKVILPVFSELFYYAAHPEKSLEHSDAPLTATQSMFADAYVEFLAAHAPAADEDRGEGAPLVAQSWTLEKDPNGNKGVESCVLLTRRQLEKLVELLDQMLEMQQNRDSASVENWASIQKLMIVTLSDPNLIKDSTDINDIAGQFTDEDIDAMLRLFPDHSTSVIHMGDIENMSDKEQDELINDLESKLDLLNQLGKEGNWIADGQDEALDFIAVPLDYLP